MLCSPLRRPALLSRAALAQPRSGADLLQHHGEACEGGRGWPVLNRQSTGLAGEEELGVWSGLGARPEELGCARPTGEVELAT